MQKDLIVFFHKLLIISRQNRKQTFHLRNNNIIYTYIEKQRGKGVDMMLLSNLLVRNLVVNEMRLKKSIGEQPIQPVSGPFNKDKNCTRHGDLETEARKRGSEKDETNTSA